LELFGFCVSFLLGCFFGFALAILEGEGDLIFVIDIDLHSITCGEFTFQNFDRERAFDEFLQGTLERSHLRVCLLITTFMP